MIYRDDITWGPSLRIGDGSGGTSGKVYIPHIDEHKVLTFTVEDNPGILPDPVDLNPFDEWIEMDEMDGSDVTDYIWEPM